MPASVADAGEAADAIAAGELGTWGSVQDWPVDRVRSGDWTPVQWYDGTLAEAVVEIESNIRLEPIGLRYEVGPAGQRIQDAYVSSTEQDATDAVPGFHSVSSNLRRTLAGKPDVWYRPRPAKRGLAERYKAQRSKLLVPMRLNTVSGRLTGVWTAQRSFGWWVPIAVSDEDRQKALAVWWNSTPVRLILLNRRAQTLTYPTWQLAHLREVSIPKPDNNAWDALRGAFDQTCDRELLPMRRAAECEARGIIDEAAALALGLHPDVLKDWRQRLAVEPTITNRRARERGDD